MVTQAEAQRRLVFHGAVTFMVGLFCGLPSVVEVSLQSVRMWQAAHSALLVLGVWLIAMAAVWPVLQLPGRERSGLLWSLVGAAYSFMIAVTVQAGTGVRAVSPDVSGISLVAFAANLVAVLSSFLAAALTIVGASKGLRAPRTATPALAADTAEPAG
ncbi:MAG: hypothetical protein ACJ8GN_27800 [Longimicrobiaceae bacterium]